MDKEVRQTGIKVKMKNLMSCCKCINFISRALTQTPSTVTIENKALSIGESQALFVVIMSNKVSFLQARSQDCCYPFVLSKTAHQADAYS